MARAHVEHRDGSGRSTVEQRIENAKFGYCLTLSLLLPATSSNTNYIVSFEGEFSTGTYLAETLGYNAPSDSDGVPPNVEISARHITCKGYVWQHVVLDRLRQREALYCGNSSNR